jgi:hypothetical protein
VTLGGRWEGEENKIEATQEAGNPGDGGQGAQALAPCNL